MGSINWKGAAAAAGGSIAALGDTMVQQHYLKQRDQRMASIADKRMDKQQAFQTGEREANQGYLTGQNELKMANSNEQAQLTRDAQASNAAAGRGHDKEMAGINAKNNIKSMVVGGGIDQSLQTDRQNHDSAKTVYLQQQESQQAALKAAAGGGGGDLNKIMADIGKTSHSMAGDLMADRLPSSSGPAYDTARAALTELISQNVETGIATNGIIDYAAASNAAVQQMAEDEKYSKLFINPEGERGDGFFGNDNQQTAAWVKSNTRPGSSEGHLTEFMAKEGIKPDRRNEVLGILRPQQGSGINQTGQRGVQGKPNLSAIQYLTQNPTPEVKAQFQSKYGYLPEGV